MRSKGIALLIVAGVLAPGSAAIGEESVEKPETAGEPVAELVIRATLPDGSPAVGVPVHEVGVERYTIYNMEVGITDENGEYVAGFQVGRQRDRTHPMGYGVYRFVLKPEDYRWEVSDIFCWYEFIEENSKLLESNFLDYKSWFSPDYDGRLEETDPANNWGYGKGVAIRKGDRQIWPVQLQPGKRLSVSVIDQFGKPVSNVNVEVTIDLQARSHTGFGGDLYQRTLIVNKDGRFELDRVGDYAYQFRIRGKACYVPDYYCYEPHLDHNIERQGATLRYQRPVPHDITFRALDAATGEPIRGVAIYDARSFPSQVQSGPPLKGKTDESGELHWDYPMALEHVAWFDAKVKGYKDARFDMKGYIEGEPIVFHFERE